MPVKGMGMSECPDNTGYVKTAGYFGIFINVTWIVIGNEAVSERLSKNHPCKHRKKDRNADAYPATPCVEKSG
jgi:hypothetical protein